MGPTPKYSPSHFHIRWESKETLDRECFRTHFDATSRAVELAGPNEIFTIEEVSADCPLRAAKSAARQRSNSPNRLPARITDG